MADYERLRRIVDSAQHHDVQNAPERLKAGVAAQWGGVLTAIDDAEARNSTQAENDRLREWIDLQMYEGHHKDCLGGGSGSLVPIPCSDECVTLREALAEPEEENGD